jgi:hypothetical protein
MFGILSCLRGVLYLLLWDLDICRVFQQAKAIEAEQAHCWITNTQNAIWCGGLGTRTITFELGS